MAHHETEKAINSTTVEVAFKEAVKADDAKASRYTIDDGALEVKNAAVKQTNNKVVVLTTSAQEAGKKYTLSVDGVKAKTFDAAASTVQPTAIALSTGSLQGVIGKEVTVTAQVTVPDGQSKAGIPVTFNIAADSTFNKNIVVEALTDENGVAKYSYTQYSKGNDTVYAYPTGVAIVKSTVGKVYWGTTDRLSIVDVTAGTTLANGAKKVYKIKASDYSQEYTNDAKTTVAYKYVNLTFAENVDVTPDKLVSGVKVIDTKLPAYNDKYPYQVTTGGKQEVRIKLDENGEATFTLTG